MGRRHGLLIGLAAVALAGVSYAATNSGNFRGTYSINGGDPGDWREPSAKDTSVSMIITGPLALRMFQELGRQSRETLCVPPDHIEIRHRGDLDCEWDTAKREAECFIRFDLRTGKAKHARAC